MKRHSSETAKNAKKPADADAGKNRRGRRYFEPVLQTLHGLFPAKFVENVGAYVDRDVRTLELWKKRQRAPDGEALFVLLTSEIGEHILFAILKTVPHRWAEDWLRALKLVRLDRQEREVKRQREALLRGVDA